MPRYFFHLHNDLDVRDEEGRELPDLASARRWAAEQARSIAAEMLAEDGKVVLHHRIDVETGTSEVVASVYFRDVLEIED